MTISLDVKELSKVYGSVTALSNFSYTFSPGIYGILGANGAGKSTLFNLLTDIISRDKGQILWNGKEISKMGRSYRAELGYMPQAQGYYSEMSTREFLNYMGRIKAVPGKELKAQVDELLSVVGLSDAAYKKMGQLSGGMRQRALLAQALLGNPKLLLLDEPTAGVDPEERIHIRSHIAAIAQNRIVLLATHIVSDVECIANQVLLMNNGAIVASGTPSELITSLQGKVAEKICTMEEVESYQSHFGYGKLMQHQQGQLLRLVGDCLPLEFTPSGWGIGLEEVYLYYCVQRKCGHASDVE